MEQEPGVVETLQQIVAVATDEERRILETQHLAPYDSGLHDEDPDEQPEQDNDDG